MFTVFIVDDEPAAVIYVRNLIKLVGEDFEVRGEYNDAQKCLKEMEKYQPDIVISDIKMPGISGLEFVKKINELFPKTICLLLSGYSEFEYAREAIRERVYEYLIKPVMPDDFVKTMNRVRITLAGRYLAERDQLIRDMYRGKDVDQAELKRYFGSERYHAVLIRKNGLPGSALKSGEKTVSSDIYESITVYGRDEREALFLIPDECVVQNHPCNIVERMKKELGTDQDSYTVVLTRKTFPVEEMPGIVEKMYARLYQTAVLGKDVQVYMEDRIRPAALDQKEKSRMGHIKELLLRNDGERAYLEFEQLCERFRQKDMPEAVVVRVVKYLLSTVWMFSEDAFDWREQEALLESLFYDSTTIKELCRNLKEFFPIKEQAPIGNKIDTEENYIRIRQYVVDHLQEPLSLGKLSREFGISQAYLTRMFKKYENMSFNIFLTAERIEKAKNLMLLHPEMYLKEIAGMVGYSDQFYFSRVFRAYTGYCPSDFLLVSREEKQ